MDIYDKLNARIDEIGFGFQHLQILTIGKGLQVADHGAGDDDVFQTLHAGNKGRIL